MLTAGVPVFRLPRELVMAEIDAILALGVELKCNQRLGRDFTIQSLRDQGYKAIFLGIGLPKGRKLDLPGANLTGVYDGMDFLRAFNEGTRSPWGGRSLSSVAATLLTTWPDRLCARKMSSNPPKLPATFTPAMPPRSMWRAPRSHERP